MLFKGISHALPEKFQGGGAARSTPLRRIIERTMPRSAINCWNCSLVYES